MNLNQIVLEPHQDELVYSTKKFVLLSGGFGNGKSYAGLIRTLILASQMEGTRHLITRETYPQLKESVVPDLFDLMPQEWVKRFSRSDNVIDLKNDSTIYLRPFEDFERLLSLNLSSYYIDQAEQATEQVFNILNSRLRQVGAPKHYAHFTCNPDAKTHWLYKRFYLEQNDMFHHIDAPSGANPHLPPEYIDMLLSTYPEELVRRYVNGEWGSVEGLIYGEFDDAVHLVEPFEIPDYFRIIVGVDHGYRNPTAFVFAAYDPKSDVVYIFDEHYAAGLRVSDHKELIREKLKNPILFNGRVDIWVGDPSMWNKTQEGYQSIALLYAQEPDPINLIRAYHTSSMGKNAGIMKVKEYMKYDPKRGVNPRIKFFKGTVPNTLREMIGYEWVKLKPHLHTNPKEEAQNKDDHTMDALRYLIYFIFQNGKRINVFARKEENYDFLKPQFPEEFKKTLPIHDRKGRRNVFDERSHIPYTVDRDMDFERRVGNSWSRIRSED